MIVTHTSNPSIDYYLQLQQNLRPGVQRAVSGTCLVGGKGLNVSMILNQLQIPSVATTYLGGVSGAFIRSRLQDLPLITLDSVPICQMNRINVKIRGSEETDINAPGPEIPKASQTVMLQKLTQLNPGDWLMICGSLGQQVDETFLLQASDIARSRAARLVLDVPKIKAALIGRCQPWLIKPNAEELYAMFDQRPHEGTTRTELIARLQALGVQNILLSEGPRGARFYSKTENQLISHPRLQAVNTVGSGDSMLAAFVGRLDQGASLEEALIWGAAAGEATAVSAGLADFQTIQKLKDNVRVSRMQRGEEL